MILSSIVRGLLKKFKILKDLGKKIEDLGKKIKDPWRFWQENERSLQETERSLKILKLSQHSTSYSTGLERIDIRSLLTA